MFPYRSAIYSVVVWCNSSQRQRGREAPVQALPKNQTWRFQMSGRGCQIVPFPWERRSLLRGIRKAELTGTIMTSAQRTAAFSRTKVNRMSLNFGGRLVNWITYPSRMVLRSQREGLERHSQASRYLANNAPQLPSPPGDLRIPPPWTPVWGWWGQRSWCTVSWARKGPSMILTVPRALPGRKALGPHPETNHPTASVRDRVEESTPARCSWLPGQARPPSQRPLRTETQCPWVLIQPSHQLAMSQTRPRCRDRQLILSVSPKWEIELVLRWALKPIGKLNRHARSVGGAESLQGFPQRNNSHFSKLLTAAHRCDLIPGSRRTGAASNRGYSGSFGGKTEPWAQHGGRGTGHPWALPQHGHGPNTKCRARADQRESCGNHNQKNTGRKAWCKYTQFHPWSSLRKFALLGGNLLLKIAVEAPRGTLTTLGCVWEGSDHCPCRRSNDERIDRWMIAASHRETLHSALKNRTSEQMLHWSIYSRMSGAWPAMQILQTQFHWPFLKDVRGGLAIGSTGRIPGGLAANLSFFIYIYCCCCCCFHSLKFCRSPPLVDGLKLFSSCCNSKYIILIFQ